MKEVSVKSEAQFLAQQNGYQLIDAQDLDKVWSEDSDRGLPVFFREGDVITFGKALKSVPFKTGIGTIVNIGHIAAQCERFGWFWFPINIFRRIPLDDERDVLFCEENDFGQKLLTSMKDIRRAEMVTGKILKISRVLDLHKPGFNRKEGKPDYDNPVRLVCYLFTDK